MAARITRTLFASTRPMHKFGIKTLLLIIALAAVFCWAYIQLVLPVREAAKCISCKNNIRQIALALHNFESSNGSLPLAIETTSDGQLWRSWRTHVYPHFMEQSPFVYDPSTAWDSPSNLRLVNQTPIPYSDKGGIAGTWVMAPKPSALCCPSVNVKTSNGINYVVVIGELTAFPRSRRVKLTEITDGLENTILVVESKSLQTHWTEPKDLDFDSMSFSVNSQDKIGIASNHPGGANVCFADGEVYFLTNDISETELRALLTISNGEPITRSQLVERGILLKR